MLQRQQPCALGAVSMGPLTCPLWGLLLQVSPPHMPGRALRRRSRQPVDNPKSHGRVSGCHLPQPTRGFLEEPGLVIRLVLSPQRWRRRRRCPHWTTTTRSSGKTTRTVSRLGVPAGGASGGAGAGGWLELRARLPAVEYIRRQKKPKPPSRKRPERLWPQRPEEKAKEAEKKGMGPAVRAGGHSQGQAVPHSRIPLFQSPLQNLCCPRCPLTMGMAL